MHGMKSPAGTPAELQQLLVDSGHWNEYAQSCEHSWTPTSFRLVLIRNQNSTSNVALCVLLQSVTKLV